MTSITPIRDPKTDWLISPENSVLCIIDYQPTQVSSLNTDQTSAYIINNLVTLCKVAKLYNVPIVLSTVNVKDGRNADTIAAIKNALPEGTPSIDRTSMNSWEDADFVAAVKATGRKKIIMTALWTEVCATFPTLDALHEGYEVYPVADAIAGTTTVTHEMALRRMQQAGATPVTVTELICELQRDWNRTETVKGFAEALLENGAFISI